MDATTFKEALLEVMEAKQHWAWPAFGQGLVSSELLHVHFEQEYATYVRDFPVLVGRAYVQCPIAEVRRELAENLYEEETGGIVATRPHPELFLEYPKGLGMDLQRFENITLLPAASRYRSYLDEATFHKGWEIAAAVTTLFIEGTPYDRGELDPVAKRRSMPPLEEHPLVRHYGLPIDALALTKAHRQVEGGHRKSAWRMILDHVAAEQRSSIIVAMQDALRYWLLYRDDVAEACGLSRTGKSTLS
ncbi:MAG: iron-containing redox enzyme family protein [Myxococcales bacterium]|nr:iron-containing redox enzyme family protein [Myxococcales bacterium]